MIRTLKRLVTWGLFAAVCCAAIPVWAAAPASIEPREFRIGLAGCFQVGSWTTASVTVTGESSVAARLVVIAPDADGQLVRSTGEERTLVPGQPRQLTARFCSGRQSGEITLRIEAGEFATERKFRPGSGLVDNMPHELQRGFRQDVPFWAVCGVSENLLAKPLVATDSAAVAQNAGNADKNAATINDDQPPQILRLSITELPANAADLASVDLIVIAAGTESKSGSNETSKPLFSQLTDRQNDALREWVEVRGGHLVVSLGSHVDEFQASKMGEWLALQLKGEDEARQLGGLEAFSGHPQPLKVDRPVSIAQIPNTIAGQILAQSLGSPLLVQIPRGFGRVSFLAVDLNRPPLATWEGTEMLLRRLHRGDRADLSRETRNQSTQLTKSGINDLSSQFYAALEDFPGVRRMSLWVVMSLLALYVLIVGPLDYLIVHRWLKRPNLTWFTFPMWIVGGALFAIWFASAMNGTRLQTKQLEIVDLDATSGVARGHSWVTLYSPKTSRRSIEIDRAPSDWLNDTRQPRFIPATNWLALAENRVGALYREGGVQLTQRQYERTADGSGISGYPLHVWSTGRFGSEWSAHAPSLVQSKLISSGFGQLTGTIQHRLPENLESCLLAYGNRVYFPVITLDHKKTSTLPANYAWDIGHGAPFEQRELRGYLTEIYSKTVKRENSTTGPEVLDVSKPYDPTRRDLPYIMRVISFYQSAGGKDYVTLRNDVLENLDLSQQIRMGRAVLIGRLKRSSAQWKVDGQPVTDPEPVTYVRIVLPVEKATNVPYRPLLKPDEGEKGPPRQPAKVSE